MDTKSLTTLACTALLLAGCGEPAGNPEPAVAPSQAEQRPAERIDWFDGTVDEAFAVAAAEGRPIFLYWGAEWCPPCHAIKATVFRSPEFIERSRLFVPVYLDGDTENAQAAGERFGVLGYPTMIVFDADGEELTRIPGGIDLEAYASVLDLTLSNSSSTRRLVDRLLERSFSLTPDECSRLAYYSWGQDTTILDGRDTAAAFRRMYEQCPETMERQRSLLYMNWLVEAITPAAEDEAEGGRLAAAEKAEALARVQSILADPVLARDNVMTLNFSGADIAAALTAPDTAARERLVRGFEAAYERLFADETLYKRERIYTQRGRIDLERIDDPDAELSAALAADIRAAAQWADASTPDVHERQPIINAMANVLAAAGMVDLRRELLLAELEVSKQPYYFMLGLADIEQEAGNREAALEWLRRAWEASTGTATRFQWGGYYLLGLLEMAPDDNTSIRETTVALITELQSGGGFHQRPKKQLARLETALEDWGEAHDGQAVLQAIRSDVRAVCEQDASESSRRACEDFLSGEGETLS